MRSCKIKAMTLQQVFFSTRMHVCSMGINFHEIVLPASRKKRILAPRVRNRLYGIYYG